MRLGSHTCGVPDVGDCRRLWPAMSFEFKDGARPERVTERMGPVPRVVGIEYAIPSGNQSEGVSSLTGASLLATTL
jgi:hypothetical protein